MRKLFVISTLFLAGCAGKRVGGTPSKPEPDMSGVMALAGRFSFASGCPIAEDTVVSAAHVADIRPFDKDAALFPYIWSNSAGEEGVIIPTNVSGIHDLALFVPDTSIQHYYPVASESPETDETLWWQEYSWASRDKAFERVTKRSTVVRIVAGHIILRDNVQHGASGSCVLNSKGEVVGIMAFGMRVGRPADENEVGGVVAVYGGRLDYTLRVKAKARELERLRELQEENP